jgi:DNA-binding MarR family transcriptional regulator
VEQEARRVLEAYPRLFFACHRRQVRDEKTRRVLTEHQAMVLDHLEGDEPLNLRRLALRTGVTPATMSIHVDRLVRKGFVRRRRDPRDRRVVQLTLTAAGARIRDSRSLLDRQRVASVLRRLRAPERREALRGLGLLARAAVDEMESRSGRRRGAGRTPAGRPASGRKPGEGESE